MKRDDNQESHAEENARGWSETINALVAALECDYDRLEELRDEREARVQELESTSGEHSPHGEKMARKALDEWDEENGEELKNLIASATVDGEVMASVESARTRIEDAPLSVQVRSGWCDPGADTQAEEFEVLLSTGGPALRIRGELDEHLQPCRAWLEHQDWGTHWTEYHGKHAPSQDVLVTFCSQFYFGG